MEKNERVYISGPMSGLKREQYMELFRRAEQSLRAQGYRRTVNPVRVWVCRYERLWKILAGITSENTVYRLTLLYDLWLLSRCDLIYKLPGWQQSHGANVESCWAYHYKIWPVPHAVIKKLDKKLAKLQEKWSHENDNQLKNE